MISGLTEKKYQIVDFHSHLLPSVDDGSKSVEVSLKMLEKMRDEGIDTVIATPHFYSNTEKENVFLERRENSVKLLSENTEKIENCPKIIVGAEVALGYGLEKCDLNRLCIGNSDVILIEMPFMPWTDYNISMVQDICYDKGKTVILAHLERYLSVESEKNMEGIFDLPVYFQINAESLNYFWIRKKILRLFEDRSAFVLGSDCHNMTTRQPGIKSARERIEKKSGRDFLQQIDRLSSKLIKQIESFG